MLYIPANTSCSPFFISGVETSELDLWAGKWGFAKLSEIGTSQFPDDSSLHVVKRLWWARHWARYVRHVLSMKLSSEVGTATNDNDISPFLQMRNLKMKNVESLVQDQLWNILDYQPGLSGSHTWAIVDYTRPPPTSQPSLRHPHHHSLPLPQCQQSSWLLEP